MVLPTLVDDGDSVERATWSSLGNFFPHYETFWQTHLVPLRSENSIYPRRGIDEDFEFLAMKHYSVYVNLWLVFERIFVNPQAGDELRFPDEIYASLHRAAELALDVVDRFKRICEASLNRKVKIDTSSIQSLMNRIGDYRNLIHQEFLAVRVEGTGRLQVPRPDKLAAYKKWTDVLYESKSEDFVDVEAQLVDDFRSLCSGLETCWKSMCEVSKQLVANKEYLERRSKGESVPFASTMAPSVSGSFVVKTVGVSNVASSTAVGAIMIRKEDK
jgi:hypothetical protein